MNTDNQPRCTLAQLRARWGKVFDPPSLRIGAEFYKHAMGGTETWRVEKIEGKDVYLVQVNATKEET